MSRAPVAQPPPPDELARFGLTEREREVLSLRPRRADLPQLIRRYRHTHNGMNRASSPRIQAAVPPSEPGTPPASA